MLNCRSAPSTRKAWPFGPPPSAASGLTGRRRRADCSPCDPCQTVGERQIQRPKHSAVHPGPLNPAREVSFQLCRTSAICTLRRQNPTSSTTQSRAIGEILLGLLHDGMKAEHACYDRTAPFLSFLELVGTFLVTIMVMGISTFLVGLLPTHRLARACAARDVASVAEPRSRG